MRDAVRAAGAGEAHHLDLGLDGEVGPRRRASRRQRLLRPQSVHAQHLAAVRDDRVRARRPPSPRSSCRLEVVHEQHAARPAAPVAARPARRPAAPAAPVVPPRAPSCRPRPSCRPAPRAPCPPRPRSPPALPPRACPPLPVVRLPRPLPLPAVPVARPRPTVPRPDSGSSPPCSGTRRRRAAPRAATDETVGRIPAYSEARRVSVPAGSRSAQIWARAGG